MIIADYFIFSTYEILQVSTHNIQNSVSNYKNIAGHEKDLYFTMKIY